MNELNGGKQIKINSGRRYKQKNFKLLMMDEGG
jgi:hypothetical protein